MAQTLRYWDGSAWTDQIAPVTTAVSPAVPSSPQVGPSSERTSAPARYDQRWIDEATTNALLWGVFFPPAGLLKSRKVRRLADGAGNLADYARKKANTVLTVTLACWAVYIVSGVFALMTTGLFSSSLYSGDEVADSLISDYNNIAQLGGRSVTMESADCDDIAEAGADYPANCKVKMSTGQEVAFTVVFFEDGSINWAAQERINQS